MQYHICYLENFYKIVLLIRFDNISPTLNVPQCYLDEKCDANEVEKCGNAGYKKNNLGLINLYIKGG